MRCCILLLLLLLLAPLARADDTLTLVGPHGRDVELRPAEGQRLLLHFWATWCPTCLEDIRHLENAATACANEHLRVVLVNVPEELSGRGPGDPVIAGLPGARAVAGFVGDSTGRVANRPTMAMSTAVPARVTRVPAVMPVPGAFRLDGWG